MKRHYFIRNGWSFHHSGNFYWFGAGYAYQGTFWLCYHFWICGFCFCMMVDGTDAKKQPRPLDYKIKDVLRKRKYRRK